LQLVDALDERTVVQREQVQILVSGYELADERAESSTCVVKSGPRL
jgi:hypothetical protein